MRHILDEIVFLEESSESIGFDDLMGDKETQRAWLRDKLIHHYFGVKWEIVWDVMNEIP